MDADIGLATHEVSRRCAVFVAGRGIRDTRGGKKRRDDGDHGVVDLHRFDWGIVVVVVAGSTGPNVVARPGGAGGIGGCLEGLELFFRQARSFCERKSRWVCQQVLSPFSVFYPLLVVLSRWVAFLLALSLLVVTLMLVSHSSLCGIFTTHASVLVDNNKTT